MRMFKQKNKNHLVLKRFLLILTLDYKIQKFEFSIPYD